MRESRSTDAGAEPRICAWCERPVAARGGPAAARRSHGICRSCVERLLDGLARRPAAQTVRRAG